MLLYRKKVDKFKDLVADRHQLSSEMQMKLLHYLTTHVDDIEVDRKYNELEEIERSLYRDITMETIDKICDQLVKSQQGSEEEEKILTDLFEIYIPEFVNKRSTEMKEESLLENEDDAVKEVESVDHPLSAPIQREVTAEYIKEKKEAIEKMVNGNCHVTDKQKKKLVELLHRNMDRFSLAGENMERTDTVTHEIYTGDARPFRERLRTYSPSVQEIIDNEVRRMLREGVIQPSKSPYASNLLLVRKPDASSPGGVKNRVCASFVQLNTQTLKDSYPLPNIQVIFDKIGGSKWFTTMDLLNGFWQVMVKPEHRPKTAFVTARGLFEFVVMPFGLCNAPATFQRLMDTVIRPEYRSFIETYVDDVMTHSKTFDDHLIHIETLLQSLREHKLVVKLTKCKFAQKEVKFLGHILTHNQMRPNPEAVETIMKWERPAPGSNKKKALRGFLGMVGWYRKFICEFAKVAKPLFHLLKDDVEWEWTDECQKSFTTLRDAIAKGPVLAIADPGKRYVLHTDASEFALGAILQQEDDNGDLHPIAYASRLSVGPAETRYSATDRLRHWSIPWALEHFMLHTVRDTNNVLALTDHAALRYHAQQ